MSNPEVKPTAAEVEASSSPQSERRQVKPRREPPGRTPDTPPPHVNPEEATPKPKAIPSSEAKPVPPAEDAQPERTASESLYGEELPPDFWDSDPVADVDVQSVTQDEPRPDEVEFAGSGRSSPASQSLTPQPGPQPRQKVGGKLEDDPRFAVMQSLFPGQIVEWQESEEVTDEEVSGEDADEPSADDSNEEVDGLN